MAKNQLGQNMRPSGRYESAIAIIHLVLSVACTDGPETNESRPGDNEEEHSSNAGTGPSTERGPGGSTDTATGSPSKASGSSWCKAKVVIDEYCTACHDGQGTGGSPMPLLAPADFAATSPSTPGKRVVELVATRIHDSAKPMPPKAKLSAEELATLDAWIAAGAPAGSDTSCGSPSGAPAAGGRVDGWDPKKCDAIYELRAHGAGGPDDPYVVSAGSEIHPQIAVDAPWGNETVQAIAFRPITDNKKVTHHWILSGGGSRFIAGWAPGDDQRPPLPDDVAIELPSGQGAFNFDFHYYNLDGTQGEPDRSGVEVCVLKQAHFRPKVAAVTGSFSTFGNGFVLAAAGAQNAPVTGTCSLTSTETIHVLTAAPHAHKRATHMKFTVSKKDGTEIVMHDQPFMFGEQGTYPLQGGEILLENGDTVYTTCSYTNSTDRNITFGESTEDEMCFNFALYYPKGAFSCSGGGLLGGL